jgi:hypothetical protein
MYGVILILVTLYNHLPFSYESSLWLLPVLLRNDDDPYQLARWESYGFFTDIDSVTWRRHQQYVHTAIHDETIYSNPSDPNDQADIDPVAWLMMNVHPFFTCPNLRRVGGTWRWSQNGFVIHIGSYNNQIV